MAVAKYFSPCIYGFGDEYLQIIGGIYPMKKTVITVQVLSIFFLLFFGCGFIFRPDIKKSTFRKLERIRNQKKDQVIRYFDDVRKKAMKVKNDRIMLGIFYKMRELHMEGNQDSSDPVFFELDMALDDNYVNNYNEFYDILFIDKSGFVFHSIKRESDYHSNLFEGKLADSKLAEHIKRSRDEAFIDYDYYLPSKEPAAFFLVPVKDRNELLGYIALQCAIDRVNAILTDRTKLGRSGEVYLVNRDKLMLTDSRFMEDSTILRQKVDTAAVRDAIVNKNGSRVIIDYRSIPVFSSFEQFEFFGNSWIIIVEIDEAEVITGYYKKARDYYIREVLKRISQTHNRTSIQTTLNDDMIKVDIGEFSKAAPGQVLETYGVNTCTAVVISKPGEFGYLVHLSPLDDIYYNSVLTRFFLRDRKTSVLDSLLKRIGYWNIYPSETGDLQIIIAATHDNSVKTVIDELIDNGINLDQIKFFYNPEKDYINVLFDVEYNQILLEWVIRKEGERSDSFFESASEAEDMGAIIKKISGFDDNI